VRDGETGWVKMVSEAKNSEGYFDLYPSLSKSQQLLMFVTILTADLEGPNEGKMNEFMKIKIKVLLKGIEIQSRKLSGDLEVVKKLHAIETRVLETVDKEISYL
jgi:hypothetical protein